MAGLRIEMITREPEWFHPAEFGREVLQFCFREFGWREAESPEGLRFTSRDFREAVTTVGKAVFTLQVIIRQKLRSLFFRSISLIAGVVGDHAYFEIYEFMIQGYLQSDIFNFTLTVLAIIAELILFLDEFGIPVSSFWYHTPWCNIYAYRLRTALSAHGGWERLLEVAKLRYTDTDFYRETASLFENNRPIRYSEVAVGNNWPENPLELFAVPPESSTLAMGILRKLYNHRPRLIPPPEEEQLWL